MQFQLSSIFKYFKRNKKLQGKIENIQTANDESLDQVYGSGLQE